MRHDRMIFILIYKSMPWQMPSPYTVSGQKSIPSSPSIHIPFTEESLLQLLPPKPKAEPLRPAAQITQVSGDFVAEGFESFFHVVLVAFPVFKTWGCMVSRMPKDEHHWARNPKYTSIWVDVLYIDKQCVYLIISIPANLIKHIFSS